MIGGGEGAPWWVTGTLFAGWLAREIWSALSSRKKNRTETDANVELINSLRDGLNRTDARIKAMEDAQDRMAARLDEEIKLRMAAQEEAHRLRLRVLGLEAAMRQIGAVIPPEHP